MSLSRTSTKQTEQLVDYTMIVGAIFLRAFYETYNIKQSKNKAINIESDIFSTFLVSNFLVERKQIFSATREYTDSAFMRISENYSSSVLNKTLYSDCSKRLEQYTKITSEQLIENETIDSLLIYFTSNLLWSENKPELVVNPPHMVSDAYNDLKFKSICSLLIKNIKDDLLGVCCYVNDYRVIGISTIESNLPLLKEYNSIKEKKKQSSGCLPIVIFTSFLFAILTFSLIIYK